MLQNKRQLGLKTPPIILIDQIEREPYKWSKQKVFRMARNEGVTLRGQVVELIGRINSFLLQA